MKIIITGATGFVGTNLVNTLSKTNQDELVSLNIRQALPETLSGDVIIHLAGKAHDLQNASDPDEYFAVNYGKTKKMFDLFLKSDIKDFIYFSSVKASADTVEGVLNEELKASPKTPYGQSKLKAEAYLLSQQLPFGKRVIILRPCMIHGPGNKGNLNLLYKVVKKGIPYPLGAFENKRSFLSIDNLLFVLDRLINDSTIPSGVYNVADDEPLSTNVLIKIIADASNSKGSIWGIPKGVVSGLARLGDILHLPLNSERLKKLTESYVVSNEKLKNALGIESFPVSSTDGLTKTIRSFEPDKVVKSNL